MLPTGMYTCNHIFMGMSVHVFILKVTIAPGLLYIVQIMYTTEHILKYNVGISGIQSLIAAMASVMGDTEGGCHHTYPLPQLLHLGKSRHHTDSLCSGQALLPGWLQKVNVSQLGYAYAVHSQPGAFPRQPWVEHMRPCNGALRNWSG